MDVKERRGKRMSGVRSKLAVMLGAAALCACAGVTTPEPKTWVGGDPTRLNADRVACHEETDNVDPAQARGYSDSRYGVASALAEAVDQDDPLRNHRADARAAAFITCMSDKGWRPG
jgi:hypothetical protein